MNNFKIICNECGSTDVHLIIEEDIVFNGEGYEGANTGNIEIICKVCKNYDTAKSDRGDLI